IVIPEGVTELRTDIFNGCVSLEEFVIPEGVTSFGDRVFRKCESLKAVDLPDGLTSLPTHAFAYCESITELEIPESVTSIGSYCFYNCDGLTELKIPDTVQEIEDACFKYADNLESITFPEGITVVNKEMFYECKGLKEIHLPSTVEEIGSYAFRGCLSLESIVLPEEITEIPSYAFTNCEALSDVTIPPSVKSIGSYAFWDCVGIKKLVLPEGLETIGSNAFKECRYLEELEIPSTVTAIKDNAFFNCHRLKYVHLPEGLKELEKYAFYGMSSVTDVTIPKAITEIQMFTFYGCKALEHVVFLGDMTSIGDNAFADCDALRTINLPQTLVSLGEGIFEGCASLVTVTIPAGVAKLSRYTFNKCDSLKNVTLAEGLAEISAYAFGECNQLETLTMPKSVRTIDSNALPKGIKYYCYKGSSSETFAKNAGERYAYIGNSEDNLIKGSINTAETKAQWTIDRDTEKMVMTWNGTMPNYMASTQPWKEVRVYISSVEIFGNVEKLSQFAFSKCERLKELTVYNRNCDFNDLEAKYLEKIYGFTGSTAEAYAKENDIAFVSIDGKHTHSLGDGIVKRASTCTIPGEEVFTCNVCQYEEVKSLPLLEEIYTTQFEAATLDHDGHFEKYCTICGRGAEQEHKTIAKVDSITLSNSAYTYNGLEQRPQVTVMDRNGALLAEGVDYDVQWPAECKNAGTYKVVVDLKGNYQGEKELTFTIAKAKITSATLSATTYTYSGVAKKPTVTVKAGTKKLASKISKSNGDVKVTYASGRKNVGTYKVTIKGQGNYTGTITKSFTITPKGTTLSSVKKGSKSFTAKWKKQSSQTTGYEIRYSTSSSMKKATIKKVKSNKTTSLKVSKLGKKKTYYVQIRTY
ncbi:MAG: leucine-rich repeat protein, partial [Firmicutes bacterium]|nr:leucine-rich repeat protein [Bacillota bacterium]